MKRTKARQHGCFSSAATSRGALPGILSICARLPKLAAATAHSQPSARSTHAGPPAAPRSDFHWVSIQERIGRGRTAYCLVSFFWSLSPPTLRPIPTPVTSPGSTMKGRTSGRLIEVMSEESLQKVIEWAGELGWNPGQRDAVAFRTADREGFFSVSDGDGSLMAGGSCRSFGAPLAMKVEVPTRYRIRRFRGSLRI